LEPTWQMIAARHFLKSNNLMPESRSTRVIRNVAWLLLRLLPYRKIPGTGGRTMNELLRLLKLAMSGLGSIVGLHLEEQPRFALLVHDTNKEIRRYAPTLIATTRTDGTRSTTSNQSFRILAGYIFGQNRKHTQIAMTAPVLQTSDSEAIPMTAPVVVTPGAGQYAMTFTLPSAYTLKTAPEPLDPRVQIVEVQSELLAAIRFSGSTSESKELAHEAELRCWLALQAGYEVAGPQRFASYDPPFTLPFRRRNEVMIPLREVGPARTK
jgi:hypothetical protein